VKVGLIRDAAFFGFIEQAAAALVKRDLPTMQQVIHRCAQLHAQHIANSGDPFEMGSTRPLDFGHWAAHKLEQMTDFRLRHGEAVAIGIALDVTYSNLVGLLADEDAATVSRCLASLNLPLSHEAMRDSGMLLEGLEEFREHLGGELTITMLRRIGQGQEVHDIDRARMVQAVQQLASQAVSGARA
jgi:3-dehydroquinate synthase